MEQRQKLEAVGRKILQETRTELLLSMHFLGPSLGSLQDLMDLSTTTVGTDAAYVRFNPSFLMQTFLEHPRRLNRTMVHMLLHCLFRHMFYERSFPDRELYHLCCDICVESVLDSMDYSAVQEVIPDERVEVYEELKKKVGVLTAPRLYQHFEREKPDYNRQCSLAALFHADDHSFWAKIDPPKDQPQSPNAPRNQENPEENRDPEDPNRKEQQSPRPGSGEKKPDEDTWKNNERRLQAELSAIGQEASDETGSLSRLLSIDLTKHADYRTFLRQFRIVREEQGIDPDSFDPVFYHLGLSLYGNIPLIEENEVRDVNRIDCLAIAIDTSASCEVSLVRNFLNESAGILLSGESFFRKVEIHVIECDDRVQNDVLITDVNQMKDYAKGFTLKGGFGTDFRPVFQYIDENRKQGKMKHLKGLMYFTDGYGRYPSRPTDYKTAFVFVKGSNYKDSGVPDWAIRLYV